MMRPWYRRHFLAIEWGIALAITMLWTFLTYHSVLAHQLLEELRQPHSLVYTLADLAGMLLGFSMIEIPIILALSTGPSC